MLQSFLQLETYSSVQVDLILKLLSHPRWTLKRIVRNTQVLYLWFYTGWMEIALLFRRKIRSILSALRPCLLLVISVALIFPLGLL